MLSERIYLPIIVFVITAFSFTGYEELPKNIRKKIDKEFETRFPGRMIEKSGIALMQEDRKLQEELKIDHIFVLSESSIPVGYLVLARADSKFDEFDYSVIYNPELKIISVKILAYREDHGGEIGSKRWLRQFEGKSQSDPLELYHDIQGISGATISCESAVNGVKNVTVFLNRILDKNN